MLKENLKTLRKSKGLTQSELAARVNVVRQTVSKWEKGLSVPDAMTLQKIAEVLETDVSRLLGADITVEADRNEIAEQLAKVNEQLAIKNRRAHRIWKAVGIIALLVVVINLLLLLLSFIFSAGSAKTEQQDEAVVEEYAADIL